MFIVFAAASHRHSNMPILTLTTSTPCEASNYARSLSLTKRFFPSFFSGSMSSESPAYYPAISLEVQSERVCVCARVCVCVRVCAMEVCVKAEIYPFAQPTENIK